jgi:shikimate dehydrogenase
VTLAAAQTRLAVLGSPIAHSLSPELHRAAYGVLGLAWEYNATEVTGETLATFLGTRDATWRGLSLTMPLKREVLPLLDVRDALVDQTGSANTVLFDQRGGDRTLFGFNTDVYGISQSFERHGYNSLETVQILGGGATAASAIAAVGRLSTSRVFVSMRSAARAEQLISVGHAHGIDVIIGTLDSAFHIGVAPDAVISTLPNGSEVHVEFAPATLASAVLFDVAYSPWPSALAARWRGDVISGLEMLVLQALVQVRIFVNGDPEMLLENEPKVLATMLAVADL